MLTIIDYNKFRENPDNQLFSAGEKTNYTDDNGISYDITFKSAAVTSDDYFKVEYLGDNNYKLSSYGSSICEFSAIPLSEDDEFALKAENMLFHKQEKLFDIKDYNKFRKDSSGIGFTGQNVTEYDKCGFNYKITFENAAVQTLEGSYIQYLGGDKFAMNIESGQHYCIFTAEPMGALSNDEVAEYSL